MNLPRSFYKLMMCAFNENACMEIEIKKKISWMKIHSTFRSSKKFSALGESIEFSFGILIFYNASFLNNIELLIEAMVFE